MRKSPLAGQSHCREFGSPAGAGHSFTPSTPGHPFPAGGQRSLCCCQSRSPCLISSCSSHLHAPGSLEEVMVSSHPTRHWKHRATKHAGELAVPARGTSPLKLKARACSLQRIKSTCSTARGLTGINLNIATTCASSGLFVTRTQKTRQKASTCATNTSPETTVMLHQDKGSLCGLQLVG